MLSGAVATSLCAPLKACAHPHTDPKPAATALCCSPPTMSLLSGKKVLLTGASRGIGAAIACAVAKEGASLTLVAHPHHEQDLKQVCGLPWTQAPACAAAAAACRQPLPWTHLGPPSAAPEPPGGLEGRLQRWPSKHKASSSDGGIRCRGRGPLRLPFPARAPAFPLRTAPCPPVPALQCADKAKSCGAKDCNTQCVDFADTAVSLAALPRLLLGVKPHGWDTAAALACRAATAHCW